MTCPSTAPRTYSTAACSTRSADAAGTFPTIGAGAHPTCSSTLPDTHIPDRSAPSKAIATAEIGPPSKTIRHRRSRTDRGAITAEYAVLIVGVCGFGGAMVALLRSPAMQAVLKGIVNFGLKLAGVEGVHL
ncbi:DUF4244 domain-containing protein [Kribbella karoonensis]